MKKRKKNFLDPILLFSAGFFVGLFIKFIPLFIILMFLLLCVCGIFRCRIR